MSHDARAALMDELARAVKDRRVLAAIVAVPRELFVPPHIRAHAYDNRALPIGSGQTISQPLVVATMCSLLDLRPTDRVLDVGAGSGYHAAVLSHLALRVHAVERERRLLRRARASLAAAGIANVELEQGDALTGPHPRAPFQAINVAAACAEPIPEVLTMQLAPGGRIVVPLVVRSAGERTRQRLVLGRREGDELRVSDHGEVRFVPLRGGG